MEILMDELPAQLWVKGTIKGELDKRGMTYGDLTRRLIALGIDENERNLRNKIARGTFSAVFFCQCLEAIGVTSLRLDMIEFVKSMARQQTSGIPEQVRNLDGTLEWVVNLKWWHDNPRPVAEVVSMPTDEYADREGELTFRCGNCGSPMIRGWTMEEVEAQFEGEDVVARCIECRRYNALPGTPLAKSV